MHRRELIEKLYAVCTWGNTCETPEDWYRIVTVGSIVEKNHLFQRLFREFARWEDVRALFSSEELQQFLRSLDRPLPRSALEKRRKVWRYLECGIKEPIPELDWIIKRFG